MTDQHPDNDRLADLHAGVLTGSDAAAAEEHLAGCPVCREQYHALEGVSAWLAAAPAVGAVPEDVRLRLAAALATEAGVDRARDLPSPSPTVVPLLRPDRGRSGATTGPRGIRVLQVAAAAVLVLGFGAVGYGAVSNGGGTSSDSAETSARTSAADGETGAATEAEAFPLTASGRDWNATDVRAAVPKLVDGSLVTPLAAADLVSPLDTTGFASAPSAAAAPGDPTEAGGALPASRLAGGPALAACVQALLADASTPAGQVGTLRPLAVDLARWQQQPAAVILLPAVAEAGRVELWVVGEDCGPGDAKVLYFADVAR